MVGYYSDDDFEDLQDCHYCDGNGLLDDATTCPCCEGSGELPK